MFHPNFNDGEKINVYGIGFDQKSNFASDLDA